MLCIPRRRRLPVLPSLVPRIDSKKEAKTHATSQPRSPARARWQESGSNPARQKRHERSPEKLSTFSAPPSTEDNRRNAVRILRPRIRKGRRACTARQPSYYPPPNDPSSIRLTY